MALEKSRSFGRESVRAQEKLWLRYQQLERSGEKKGWQIEEGAVSGVVSV